MSVAAGRTRFALIGAAGFVAPRHMRAIRDAGGQLVAAVDPKDSVGVIDEYFPEAAFFTEFERFDRHLDKLRRRGEGVEFVSICSPNYLHDAHIRFAMRSGAHALCEKPTVLNPWNLDGLEEVERESGRRVWTVLQLRLHPVIRALRAQLAESLHQPRRVRLTYITTRGTWYHHSWKGQMEKSGGVSTNIGIHFFDMLQWVFGACSESRVHRHQADCAAGVLRCGAAQIEWFLSVNAAHLPEAARTAGRRTHRSIEIDGKELEFSEGFGDLHTETYREMLGGRGFGLADVRPAVQMAHEIRNATLSPLGDAYHPLAAAVQAS
jgi:UDP-N-acetyl-2-amino-2-deoxyglucuronate dehydrogenase